MNPIHHILTWIMTNPKPERLKKPMMSYQWKMKY